MGTRAIVSAALAMSLGAASLVASGPVGIYGIVEKVVFEPNEAKAERIQVFGAFAYVDSRESGTRPGEISKVARGYMYFTIPGPDIQGRAPEETANVRREWADLKAVAGTGQAVGFGMWGYPRAFSALDPSASGENRPNIVQRGPRGSEPADLRVRPASEKRSSPALYQTNAGVVKLSESSHADVIAQLRAALRK